MIVSVFLIFVTDDKLRLTILRVTITMRFGSPKMFVDRALTSVKKVM
jgi:hypothetical protein